MTSCYPTLRLTSHFRPAARATRTAPCRLRLHQHLGQGLFEGLLRRERRFPQAQQHEQCADVVGHVRSRAVGY